MRCPLQDGHAAARLREMTLARPRRPEEEDVFALEDEAAELSLRGWTPRRPGRLPGAKSPLQRPRLPRVKLLGMARPHHLQH